MPRKPRKSSDNRVTLIIKDSDKYFADARRRAVDETRREIQASRKLRYG